MVDALDVLRPIDGDGILRSSNAEFKVRETACGLDQQIFERRLAIIAVGAEIGEVPALRQTERRISVGVDGAIERPRAGRPISPLNPFKRRSAGERKIEIVAGDQVRRKIFEILPLELAQGYGRVDVVKCGY